MKPTLVSRDVVYWFGGEPTVEERAEFRNRGLTVECVTDGEGPLNLNIARGAVFAGKPPYLPEVCSQLHRVGPALEHGLFVYLVADDESAQAHLGSLLPPELLSGGCKEAIRRRTGMTERYELAENIARHVAGPGANSDLEISLRMEVELRPAQRFLLTRAFGDCTAIALKPLHGGRSGLTFEVQATLRASEAGPRPLPFFAKLDTPRKIVDEQNCYRDYAALHIPWYLRPNLDPSRSIVGTECAILVGSFVDQSESLWDAAQKGRGSRYIHALFEETLLGWRSQAYRQPPVTGRLANALSSVYDHRRVRPEHLERAQHWGATRSPQALWEQLLNLPEQKLRYAPMHGDMHAKNVMVRSNDAIIIDLAKTGIGPLCADLASLDVYLSTEVPDVAQPMPAETLWTAVATELYSPAGVSKPPREERVDVGLEWLRACIRTIRVISASICECDTEYKTAVALYLLRRAQYAARGGDDARVEADGYRRAYAFWLGAQLVEDLVHRGARSAARPGS